MYVVARNGILIYEGIDKRDSSQIVPRPITYDFKTSTLSPGALDCKVNG